MPKFTSDQQLAIDKDKTSIIVSAGAGSGKTKVLTTRIARLIDIGIPSYNILIKRK